MFSQGRSSSLLPPERPDACCETTNVIKDKSEVEEVSAAPQSCSEGRTPRRRPGQLPQLDGEILLP